MKLKYLNILPVFSLVILLVIPQNSPASALVDVSIDLAKWGLEMGIALDDYKPFTTADSRYAPDYTPPGMPKVPSKCKSSRKCQQCFKRAQSELDYIQYYLEKLRAIYQQNKDYRKRVYALGDSAGSVHIIVGIEWSKQKKEADKAFRRLERIYDKKYIGLTNSLHTSLKRLGGCEAKYFGQHDWYDRYGFIYYQFMKNRYRR